ncbi:MAG: formimidoylglutamase [Bacteroidales bacterium]|nr:formimidoylglutamase [Bacteroidales bacterium]
MDISVYFDPLDLTIFDFLPEGDTQRLGNLIVAFRDKEHFPALEEADLAIIGVGEDRNAVTNEGCAEAPDPIRNELYSLFSGTSKPRIIDLGNLKRGHSVDDTYFALTSVVETLIGFNIIPVIIGGSHDLTFAIYKAYESMGQVVNILAADPKFDLGKTGDDIHAQNYLNKIILRQPNYLFNFTNIGYQTYMVDPESIKLMNNLYFDIYRLGNIRDQIEEVEPLTRNADIVSIDIGSVRHSDAPGNYNALPNGFFGDEMCRITRYAGISDKVTSFGIFEYNPSLDVNRQTARLISQMIWYFIEGFYNRKHDHPYREKEDYIKYTVTIRNHHDHLVFYKSKKSDRWWMDVPVKKDFKSVYERHHLVPCSYADYETACNDDIPDRWWQAYQKLM